MFTEMPAKTDIPTETGNEKRAEDYFFRASAEDFKKIPGSPIAYWVSEKVRDIFTNERSLSAVASPCVGLQTADNDRFLRLWHEVDYKKIGFGFEHVKQTKFASYRWYPYNKGGGFRKYYGNRWHVVNWQQDGQEIRNFKNNKGKVLSRPQNTHYYFKEGITWGDLTSSSFSARYTENGFIFDVKGSSGFTKSYTELLTSLMILNSKISSAMLSFLNPTLSFQVGDLSRLPIPSCTDYINLISYNAKKSISISKEDWNSYETSYDFKINSLLYLDPDSKNLSQSYATANNYWQTNFSQLSQLEETSNRLFIEAYGLQDELTPDVPLNEITLTCNPHYRYGNNKSEQELEDLLRADTMKELISYAIGCMMGRYSLDEEGLIYAHSANEGFDATRYPTFPADDDGIVPVMDTNQFDDDASKRFEEFLNVAWNEETLEENLKFVADSLTPKRGEEPRETIRRFISTKFFKDHHLKVYKKRPIYWLFSSGKNKAFECLVYLHRYNEKTLSRMRAMYVTPLQGKFNATIEYLQKEKDEAPSTSAARAIQKQLTTMLKKQEELRAFDELLRHYADQRITLDLDDGVKVNYGKFGKLLAEVKAVTGKKAE